MRIQWKSFSFSVEFVFKRKWYNSLPHPPSGREWISRAVVDNNITQIFCSQHCVLDCNKSCNQIYFYRLFFPPLLDHCGVGLSAWFVKVCVSKFQFKFCCLLLSFGCFCETENYCQFVIGIESGSEKQRGNDLRQIETWNNNNRIV